MRGLEKGEWKIGGKEERVFQGRVLMELRKTAFNKRETLAVYNQNAIKPQKPNSKLHIFYINHHS